MTHQISSVLHSYLQHAIDIGLSGKAASVYVTLLEAGVPLSPKVLILRTGLHRQYLYDGIRELDAKGLLLSTGEQKRTKYSALRPDVVIRDIERNRILALEHVSSLMQLYQKSPTGMVEVISGDLAVIESEMALLGASEKGDFLDIIGGAGNSFVSLFAERIEEYEQLRKERGVVLRYIGSPTDVAHNKTSVIANDSRVLPGIENIVNVCIRPGSVSFNIYHPEIVTVRVRNEASVKSQRALFEILWSVAKHEV